MKKILVVEDVAFNRDLMVQLLEEEYEVLTAVDGLEGVERAERDRPDLILMDLSLPGLGRVGGYPAHQSEPGAQAHPDHRGVGSRDDRRRRARAR